MGLQIKSKKGRRGDKFIIELHIVQQGVTQLFMFVFETSLLTLIFN